MLSLYLIFITILQDMSGKCSYPCLLMKRSYCKVRRFSEVTWLHHSAGFASVYLTIPHPVSKRPTHASAVTHDRKPRRHGHFCEFCPCLVISLALWDSSLIFKAVKMSLFQSTKFWWEWNGDHHVWRLSPALAPPRLHLSKGGEPLCKPQCLFA